MRIGWGSAYLVGHGALGSNSGSVASTSSRLQLERLQEAAKCLLPTPRIVLARIPVVSAFAKSLVRGLIEPQVLITKVMGRPNHAGSMTGGVPRPGGVCKEVRPVSQRATSGRQAGLAG